jgi:archaellum component FlaF (FlaF/FlaG flagellin family)
MDEWIQVNFPETRDVLVDGMISGSTNVPFILQRGTYTITLNGPQNYTSPPMPFTVVAPFQTSRQRPLPIDFTMP